MVNKVELIMLSLLGLADLALAWSRGDVSVFVRKGADHFVRAEDPDRYHGAMAYNAL